MSDEKQETGSEQQPTAGQEQEQSQGVTEWGVVNMVTDSAPKGNIVTNSYDRSKEQ